MPVSERKARHAELYAALLRNDISKWGDKFLKALSPPSKQSEQGLSGFMPAASDVESERRPATRQ
jgi:trehalose-6-phosphate synthase